MKDALSIEPSEADSDIVINWKKIGPLSIESILLHSELVIQSID